MSHLSFDNGWTNHNADCCVNTVDEYITTATNLINFDPVTPEILWLICMGDDCRQASIRTVLVKDHPHWTINRQLFIVQWSVGKKCIVVQCAWRAGYTLGFASLSSSQSRLFYTVVWIATVLTCEERHREISSCRSTTDTCSTWVTWFVRERHVTVTLHTISCCSRRGCLAHTWLRTMLNHWWDPSASTRLSWSRR